MNNIVSKPWFLAILGLALLLGAQAVAFTLYWDELFPGPSVLVVSREDPSPIHWSFDSEEISRLEEELKRRAAQLDEKESSLEAFEERLQADKAEVEAIKRDVERLRERLFDDIVSLEASEKGNLKTLAKTYANLEPAAAVSIFEELDDPTVVKILFFMRPETVGEILQQMAAQGGGGSEERVRRAARLSNMLRLFTDKSEQPQRNS